MKTNKPKTTMKNKNNAILIRQGDVALISCDETLVNATLVKPENGLVILAHGEVTGHHHSILERHATEFATGGGARILKVEEGAALVHQEHGAIPVPVGHFRVIRQCEYSPEAIRNVAD